MKAMGLLVTGLLLGCGGTSERASEPLVVDTAAASPERVVAETTTSTTSTVVLTVPELVLPVASWSGPSVVDSNLAPLAGWWREYYGDTGCPLLASVAQSDGIGATGYPTAGLVGTAGGGPLIEWPGQGAPAIFVFTPPLDADDPSLALFFADSVNRIQYADGSEERIVDGQSLVLLPGVPCAYEFFGAEAQVLARNFFSSIKVIDTATAQYPPVTTAQDLCPVGGFDVLRRGDGGTGGCPDIREAQRLLSAYFPEVVIDGIFGASTEAAVRQFQADYGLEVDGLIGPETWSYLIDSQYWDF